MSTSACTPLYVAVQYYIVLLHSTPTVQYYGSTVPLDASKCDLHL